MHYFHKCNVLSKGFRAKIMGRYSSSSMKNSFLRYSDEVKAALFGNKPIVALESTIISHGMPFPKNLQMASEVENTIRSMGATPATIAILNGEICVGLDAEQLKTLAELGTKAKKCSKRDIAPIVVEQETGATTVSSTMYIANQAGISVFVTGGIGGVHRYVEETMDISSDLTELSHTPVAVVCSGVKSILDIEKTLEYLETAAVPVISYGVNNFPAFFTDDSGFAGHYRCDSPEEIAEIVKTSKDFKLSNGFVIGVPNPHPAPKVTVDEATETALKEAKQSNVSGNRVTPYLLRRVNELTGGVSLESNIALVKANAVVGSQIAISLNKMNSHNKSDVLPSNHINETLSENPTQTPDVLVMGGTVLDLIGKPKSSNITHGSSNIGNVYQHWGGVGRNIAECIHRLGIPSMLISCVGKDISGDNLINYCKNIGMETCGIQKLSNLPTAVYSAILSPQGDLEIAIADMDIFERLNIDQLPLELFKSAKMVVFDGNFSASQMGLIGKKCTEFGVPVWFEPTSVDKAVRPILGNCVSDLHFISPNVDELAAMADKITNKRYSTELVKKKKKVKHDMKTIKKNMQTVLEAMTKANGNVEKHLFVTMGKEGVLIGSSDIASSKKIAFKHILTKEKKMVNCTGAGDSFVAGTVYGLIHGKTAEESCLLGMKAASKSIESNTAIHPELSVQDLL